MADSMLITMYASCTHCEEVARHELPCCITTPSRNGSTRVSTLWSMSMHDTLCIAAEEFEHARRAQPHVRDGQMSLHCLRRGKQIVTPNEQRIQTSVKEWSVVSRGRTIHAMKVWVWSMQIELHRWSCATERIMIQFETSLTRHMIT